MIFPPVLLDSSSCWNTDHNQLQVHQIGSNIHITTTPSPAGHGDEGDNNSNQEGFMATAEAGGGGGARDGDGGGSGNSKPMSMSERARLARVPQPVSRLNCPRCDSTNTKFCYFNNYSLTQPRHFCRACRRYWTHGGVIRNVPIGGGYRRHTKRRDKTNTASAAFEASVTGTSSGTLTPSSTSCANGTGTTQPGLQYSMFGSGFADSFDPASLGLWLPARLLFADSGTYVPDGCAQAQQHLHQDHGNGMEQWAAPQMDSLPFMHAMDHQMSGPPAEAMPITMAAMEGMFHFHLGQQSGGGGGNDDDGEAQQFHHPPAKINL